jgi:hypothetical protein
MQNAHVENNSLWGFYVLTAKYINILLLFLYVTLPCINPRGQILICVYVS